LYRKPKSRKIEERSGRISRGAKWRGDAAKSELYRNLQLAAKQRADEKQSPATLHSTRRHLTVSDAPPVYNAREGRYTSLEQKARETRASRAGHFSTNLTTRNPKKLRKDAALRKMAKTTMPKSGYGEWSKEKLKETYYDIINYLLNEGYANDFESADGIIQVMSEEWFMSIYGEL
jgi:hypothetical protein